LPFEDKKKIYDRKDVRDAASRVKSALAELFTTMDASLVAIIKERYLSGEERF
jgi:hypothetical protein